MSNAPNDNLSQEAPQWMMDTFEGLKDMFEELFPDADKLNLEEVKRGLDEQQAGVCITRDGPSRRIQAATVSKPTKG